MRKQKLRTALIFLAAYLLMLLLLVYAESCSPETTITSLPLAVWYSLVTMTTVGYGDLYPVTAAGKVIGVLFLLLSAGALTALISFGVSWIGGTGLPRMRLRRIGRRKVYIFGGKDSAGEALAQNIHKEDREALCIFSCEENAAEGRNTLQVSLGVPEILQELDIAACRPTVVYTGADAEEQLSRTGLPEGVELVCRTAYVPEALQEGKHFFDRDQLCAAMYWQRFPLGRQEKTVMLVGFGKLGRQLLEYALENCILSPVRTTEYHVFGADDSFLLDHPCLESSVSVGKPSEIGDSLFLHADAWNASMHLLMTADRIVFCADDENENTALYSRLRTFFPVTGKVHLYRTGSLSGDLPAFGIDGEVYTPEAVLRAGLERLAREMHESYRAGSGGNAPAWEELSPFLRHSNFASAQHIPEKLRFLLDDDTLTDFTAEQLREGSRRFRELKQSQPDLCRRIEHDRWMRFHAMYNWNYAPVRNNAMRCHPLMLPFDQLSKADQAKDDYAWELIETLADRI